jgi:hypothetical protein
VRAGNAELYGPCLFRLGWFGGEDVLKLFHACICHTLRQSGQGVW